MSGEGLFYGPLGKSSLLCWFYPPSDACSTFGGFSEMEPPPLGMDASLLTDCRAIVGGLSMSLRPSRYCALPDPGGSPMEDAQIHPSVRYALRRMMP